jgi:hypothetical protein
VNRIRKKAGVKMNNPWAELTNDGIAKIDAEILQREEYRCELELGIPPAPFYGNVKNSKIVLLNGNPGFDGKEHIEQTTAEFIHDNNECLRQTDSAEMFSLKPQYSETSHGKWWIKKMTPTVDRGIHTELFGSVKAYREFLIRNLSVIEFVGYHSKNKPSFVNTMILPSQEYSSHLVKQAMRDGKVILIMRWNKEWLNHIKELEEYPYLWLNNVQNVVISEKNVISPDGRMWSDILRQLAEEDKNLSN